MLDGLDPEPSVTVAVGDHHVVLEESGIDRLQGLVVDSEGTGVHPVLISNVDGVEEGGDTVTNGDGVESKGDHDENDVG